MPKTPKSSGDTSSLSPSDLDKVTGGSTVSIGSVDSSISTVGGSAFGAALGGIVKDVVKGIKTSSDTKGRT